MAAVLSIPFEISASITLGKGLFQCRGEKSDYKFKKNPCNVAIQFKSTRSRGSFKGMRSQARKAF